ncbi:S8 family serine peptidase [Spirosoma sp. KNUC1025]|uniref:S8 family serine peptidase n=1 Tax=Spirosoma sp. KNUC1025 TaxID=2894082 RepID=UPI003864B440|nr:S8 family serine peptidase [Spirosoma sp. KNUC1025]
MFNPLRHYRLGASLAGLLLCFSLTGGYGQTEIKEEARAAKLSPDLLSLQLKEGPLSKSVNQKSGSLRQAAASDEFPLKKMDRTQIRNGMIAINAIANAADGQALLADLQGLGLTEGRYYQKIVFGYFPVDKLGLLRNVSTLHMAKPAYKPLKKVGKTTSQGDLVMRADIARQTYNVTGAGSKVGVLSDSYDALGGAAAGVANDDLPPNVEVLADLALKDDSALIDEGRGMAEIVHDVAPGAKIAFHTAFASYVDFALGILQLGQVGCNIIVDDVSYTNEPFFQDGIIAQAVNYVNKTYGATYFSSAGNSARQSYTSGFRNSGKLPPLPPDFYIPGSAAHDFGNGKITQKITIPPGRSLQLFLQWADPFYSESVASGGVSGAKTDIDIIVYYQGNIIPSLSSLNSNIGDDPYEDLFLTNISRNPIELEIALVKYDGPDPALIKWIDWAGDATVEFNTHSSTLYGHANAKGAIAVAATPWYRTPVYNAPRYPIPVVEEFSSAGGTPILFTTYGQPIPAEVRLKPEITAPDGGNTSFFPPFPGQDLEGDGFPNFFGTSAAAPHAAGVAALLKERSKNSMGPDDILLRLRTTAIDMDDPFTTGFDMGFDFRTGFGFIQADKALMYGQPLVILEPLYDCATGKITIRTSGGDGSPITITAPGVKRTGPTSYTTLVSSIYTGGPSTVFSVYIPASLTGIVEAELRNDPKSIIITAEQSGIKVVYDFNFAVYCNSQPQARIASTEPGAGLQITTLGNPISTDWLEVEVRGVQGQPLNLQINNMLGEIHSSRAVKMAEPVERHKLKLGSSPGLYFLQVSTPTETKTLKVVRQ